MGEQLQNENLKVQIRDLQNELQNFKIENFSLQDKIRDVENNKSVDDSEELDRLNKELTLQNELLRETMTDMETRIDIQETTLEQRNLSINKLIEALQIKKCKK